MSAKRTTLFVALVAMVTLWLTGACHRNAAPIQISEAKTFAELRAIKGDVKVQEQGAAARVPYARERLADAAEVTLVDGGLAWLRRDVGAVLLVSGPAHLVVHEDALDLTRGRMFVDTSGGPPVRLKTPRGLVELADGRTSVDVAADGAVSTYVLRGSARWGTVGRAGPGEMLSFDAKNTATIAPVVAWNDWTGGLATTDTSAEPAPFGVGTVGARPPGDKGKPRFSLVIQRLEVRVSVDHDFAVTEVDETFVNPSATTVEGIFSFRTPPGAVLQRFGVDRNGDLVWGRVKESAAAVAQYESNVYAGSTENPALLTWTAPGVYSARLYPIEPGTQRRVVTRYTEWLPREGPRADRRLYVYPMAAEGARASLPRIEELNVTLDLARAGARHVRSGMGGRREGERVVITAFDVVPLADLAVELLDDGGDESTTVAYRASHALLASDAPAEADAKYAAKVSREEPDYLLVPLRTGQSDEPVPEGIDLAVVVDTSAATESGALSVARSLATALLSHLGPSDRAALWAGDATLHAVTDGSDAFSTLDDAKRRAWLDGLSAVDRGGATDLGAILTEAASKLDPKRRSAVVYVGDGQPSVGEIAPKALRERLARLPAGTRIFTCALGTNANTAVLSSIARGAPLEIVSDGYGAARTALRLLAAAYRPTWVGASVDLGSGIERILPHELPAVGADEGVLVVGRVTGKLPTEITLRSGAKTMTRPLRIDTVDDGGNLRRRWAEQRIAELVAEGAGRASVVDVGKRYGLVSPFTALYVPTSREEVQEVLDPSVAIERDDRRARWKPWSSSGVKHEATAAANAFMGSEDDKQGGTGTRAKGEEGSMGNPNAPRAPAPMRKAQAEATQFGIIGMAASAAPPPAATMVADEQTNARMAQDALGLSASDKSIGVGGGGRGEGIGLQDIGTIGNANGQAATTPQAGAFGMGHGRVGGQHQAIGPQLREGGMNVNGRLPPEVVQRIVRQNFGRFKLCYSQGLRNNPTLEGRVTTKFIIGRDGSVAMTADAGSDLPDASVTQCVVRSFTNLSFPQPEGGNVTVVYPLLFTPGGGPDTLAPVTPAKVEVHLVALASVGHAPRPCSAAADLAFDERRTLWAERLSAVSSASAALEVYRHALADCEAPSWRERHTLLLMMVGRLPNASERVALWRDLLDDAAEADLVYRAMLARVQNASDLKQLHDALGLKSIDADLLATMLARGKTPQDRLALLRAAALKWQDDLELALRVLDAYDDLGDDSGGRAWARRLRHQSDATSHVYTRVGEYYLRLSRRESGPVAARDADDARRTFGEIVEFAPEDPVARRRLGDLLRAHGWYEEAFRQYETLAQLTPDDASVPLLLASAAQGMGRIEEAVSWAEKAAATGAPDGTSALAKSARATASAFIAWAEEQALKAGKKDDADKLRARAKRVAGTDAAPDGSVRFIVTWAHPELHPVMWTTALGAPMPATDNFPFYGVAEGVMPAASPAIELRLDPEEADRAARLGATVIVTALVSEGTPLQRIAHVEVGFADAQRKSMAHVRVRLEGDSLRVEAAP